MDRFHLLPNELIFGIANYLDLGELITFKQTFDRKEDSIISNLLIEFIEEKTRIPLQNLSRILNVEIWKIVSDDKHILFYGKIYNQMATFKIRDFRTLLLMLKNNKFGFRERLIIGTSLDITPFCRFLIEFDWSVIRELTSEDSCIIITSIYFVDIILTEIAKGKNNGHNYIELNQKIFNSFALREQYMLACMILDRSTGFINLMINRQPTYMYFGSRFLNLLSYASIYRNSDYFFDNLEIFEKLLKEN